MKGACPASRLPDHALSPEGQARLTAFKAYAVTHPRLEETGIALMHAMREPAGFAHVLLYGPTGVGKTTVLQRVTSALTPLLTTGAPGAPVAAPVAGERALYPYQAQLAAPLLLLEARIPDGGTFNRGDYYRTALVQLGEPFYGEYRFIDINEGQTWETKTRSRGHVTPFNDAHHLRHALEEAVARRGVRAVVIDEAQHLMKVAGGAKLLDQLDWLKSMSNTMGVVHVLGGTYDLLDLRNLSGQTARRGHDIHFPRYQFQQEADQIAFQRALRGLLEHVPLRMDLQELMNHWHYFYERSIGCIGVLKDWLVRTLSATRHRGTDTLTLDRLQAHALSNAQCERMAADATAAEHRLHYTESSREHLWSLLGMRGLPRNRVSHSPQEQRHTALGSVLPTEPPERRPRPPRVQVGHRAPGRDPVGTRPQTDTPKKCPFSGEVELSPAQLRQSAIAKLQCPECSATRAARLRGETVVFPSHPPRSTKMTRDISRWIKHESGWTLYKRGE
jgi:DNA polymerase III delta prime subunit